MKRIFRYIFILFIVTAAKKVAAQSFFTTAGNAYSSGGGCYVLTPNLNWQQGTAWYTTPVSLLQPLTIQYNLNFGTLDAGGADGIAFVLQNQGTAVVGGAGIGIGYQGISPSVVVEFDTWQNGFDPPNDHIALTLNGDPDHTVAANIGNPLGSFLFNIEDGAWHTVEVSWDPAVNTLKVKFDCQVWLTYTNDIVNNVFGGNPLVWWGFTSATGGATNLHQFCHTPPFVLTLDSTNILCKGQCTGTASVTNIAGGTGPFTYSWSNGGTGSSVSGLCAGTHTVAVTSSQGCVSMDSITVSEPASILTATVMTVKNVSCSGGNDGSASASPSGGTGTYTFSWSNGETTQTASTLNAVPGLHTVTVTDNNGCIATNTVLITEPLPLSLVVSKTNVLCKGGNTGSAAANISGGTAPYAYLWSNSQTSSACTGLIAGNYSVVATDAKGCTSSVSFTITEPAALALPAAGSTSEYCNRSDGIVFVATAGGAGGYTYLWMPVAATTSAVTGLAAGNYSVTVTDANGCAKDTSVSVSFISGPVASAGPDITVCSGSIATLGAGGGGSYSWSPVPGLSSSTVANPVVSITSSVTYTVTVTDANNCSASDDVAVTVYPTPVAGFTSSTVCFNNPTLFTDNSSGSIAQWSWNFGDGAISSQQSPAHTYITSGTFSVTLIVSSSQGCSDTASANVTVFPLPVSAFFSTTVCVGGQTCFTDQSGVSPGNIISWSWNFADPASGAANVSTLKNPCHLFSSAGLYNVLLTVTSSDGCQSSAVQQAAVLAPPVASFSVSPVCLNTPAQFNDASTSATQWFWQFGDGGISNQQNPAHTYLNYGNYVVTLIASSTGNCIDTTSDTITVNPLPVTGFISDTVCLGDSTSFINLSYMPAGTIASWHWDFGNGDSSSVKDPFYVFPSPGNHSVTLSATSSSGCMGSVAIPVLVYPLPDANFSFSPPPVAALTDIIYYKDLSAGSPVSWWWEFGDGDTSVLQNPLHNYKDTGSFVVTLVVTSSDGCVDTARQLMEIRDFAFYIPAAFSPNEDDVNDLFFGKGVGIKEYEFFIFDRWGNRIFYCHVNDLPQTLPCMWDGKVEAGLSNYYVQQDVYVWKVYLTNVFGERYTYVGNVTVVR